jgi:hypothetical protein
VVPPPGPVPAAGGRAPRGRCSHLAAGGRSSHAHGEPYSVSRSRNGPLAAPRGRACRRRTRQEGGVARRAAGPGSGGSGRCARFGTGGGGRRPDPRRRWFPLPACRGDAAVGTGCSGRPPVGPGSGFLSPAGGSCAGRVLFTVLLRGRSPARSSSDVVSVPGGALPPSACSSRHVCWVSTRRRNIKTADENSLPVVGVAVIGDRVLRLLFSDGTAGDVDFSAERWTGVLSPLNDPAYFAEVAVDAEAERSYGPTALTWPPNRSTSRPRRTLSSQHRDPVGRFDGVRYAPRNVSLGLPSSSEHHLRHPAAERAVRPRR